MTVTTNYSTPGVFPGAQASAAGQPAAPQSTPAAGISITVHPDILAVKEKLQSHVANWGLYHWAGLVGFLVILLMYRSQQAEKQRQRLRSMRADAVAQSLPFKHSERDGHLHHNLPTLLLPLDNLPPCQDKPGAG